MSKKNIHLFLLVINTIYYKYIIHGQTVSFLGR